MSNEIEVFRLTILKDAYNNIKNWRANAGYVEAIMYIENLQQKGLNILD